MTGLSIDTDRKTIRKRWMTRSFAAIAVLLLVAYVATSWLIGSSVRTVTAAAQSEHPGDRIAALMAYVDSPAHGFKNRNRAVWALGQMGNPRALPLLERFYTGEPCDHERSLCQYELKKAIRLCRGATNLSAFVWRRGSLRPASPPTSQH
jgi:hypothetical protein